MSTGLHVFVVGRFSPLHHGHLHLLDAACALGGRVYVLSYASPEAPGCSAARRTSWLRDAARTRPHIAAVEVRSGPEVPPDLAPAAVHRAYCGTVIESLGWPINHVASSETYGPGLSTALQSHLGRPVGHTTVDLARDKVPISATQLRADPLAHRDRLPPQVLDDYLDDRLRSLGTAPPMPAPSHALAAFNLTRSDLYDAFLGRHAEAPAAVAFLQRAGVPPAGRVLDAGCGTGRLLTALRAAGMHPTGLEPDPDYLQRARATGCTVHQGTFTDAAALQPGFDAVVLANGPLVYLLHPTQRISALRVLATTLRPGGVLVVDIPHLPWIYRTTYRAPTPRTVDIAGATVTRYPSHRIDPAAGRWHHTDHHRVQRPNQTTAWCAESFVFAMLNRATVSAELHAAGLRALTWWTGWTATQPGGPQGPRLLVTAHPQATLETAT